jgi:hypothetical protein
VWDVPTATAAHDTLTTPDLSEIVAEVVAQDGWVSGRPIALVFRHVGGRGSRWLQAESQWNGMRTPALLVAEGVGAEPAAACAMSAACPFQQGAAPTPCEHPACLESGTHRARTCCYAIAAYCDGSGDAACTSAVTACAALNTFDADAAALKLSTACAGEFAECAGSPSCAEDELMALLAPLDTGAQSVDVALPYSYATMGMTQLMICGLQFAATPDIEVTADSCTSTLVATVTHNDTVNCNLMNTSDFGVTAGNCSAVEPAAFTCDLVPGEYADIDGDGAMDHVAIAETCTSTVVPAVTALDTALCILSGTADFGVTLGTCAAVGSTATCAYVEGEYASSGNNLGYGFLQPETPCAVYPCGNGGACTEDSGAPSGFTCSCLPGYEGDTCEDIVDECASSPCLNGGSCLEVEEIDAFSCACALNYRGDVCQDLTGSVGASFDSARAVTADEIRSAISAMIDQPVEQITLTSLEYTLQVELTVQLALGHTLTHWHPYADAQLEQGVRDSLSAPHGFLITRGGSDPTWKDVDEYAVDEHERTGGHGRRLLLSPVLDDNETAASATTAGEATVQMPADTYGRKVARRLLKGVESDEAFGSVAAASAAGATASQWLEESIVKAKGIEARNDRVDELWEGAGIKTPAFAKRGRGKVKKQRAAMEAAQQIEIAAQETKRRQMAEDEAAEAAAAAAAQASWSYTLVSDVDLASEISSPGYGPLLSRALNGASGWCRASPVIPCRRDQIDELKPNHASVEVMRITTAVEYEVLMMSAEPEPEPAANDDGSSSTKAPEIQLIQELWRLGVPIAGEATLQALPEGTCTRGAMLNNSDRAHAHQRCRGAIGATCPYTCDQGYVAASATLVCSPGGAWLGGECYPEDEIRCPVTGHWWHLQEQGQGLAVLTDESSDTATITSSQLTAQEPWSNCIHSEELTSVSVAAVCATGISSGGSGFAYEPCGSELDVGVHTVLLLASVITAGSEVRAVTSFTLTVADKEPPRLDLAACPVSMVTTWMFNLHASVGAIDNCGEVRISACTTDVVTEVLAERAPLTGRRTRMGFVVEPGILPKTYATTRCYSLPSCPPTCHPAILPPAPPLHPHLITTCLCRSCCVGYCRLCAGAGAGAGAVCLCCFRWLSLRCLLFGSSWPETRCIASSVSGHLSAQLDVATAGPGSWLVITAEDLSGNVDRCHSLVSEW